MKKRIKNGKTHDDDEPEVVQEVLKAGDVSGERGIAAIFLVFV